MIRVKCNAKLLDPNALRECASFLRENVVVGFNPNRPEIKSNEVSEFLESLAEIVEAINDSPT